MPLGPNAERVPLDDRFLDPSAPRPPAQWTASGHGVVVVAVRGEKGDTPQWSARIIRMKPATSSTDATMSAGLTKIAGVRAGAATTGTAGSAGGGASAGTTGRP